MNTQPDTHTAPAVLDEDRYLTQTEATSRYGLRVANALSSAARNINHPVRRRKRGSRWEYNESDIVAWIDWQQEKELAAKERQVEQQTRKAVLIDGMSSADLVANLKAVSDAVEVRTKCAVAHAFIHAAMLALSGYWLLRAIVFVWNAFIA